MDPVKCSNAEAAGEGSMKVDIDELRIRMEEAQAFPRPMTMSKDFEERLRLIRSRLLLRNRRATP